MPKIPYKPEKSGEKEDDYEIVSFEDFCDKSPGSKTDLLTLNDNINYRLCFEGNKKVQNAGGAGESSGVAEHLTETSLSGPKNVRVSNSFAPFGKYTGNGGRASLFSGVIPKLKEEVETSSTSAEPKYKRLSRHRNLMQRLWECRPSVGSGMVGIAVLCAVCVAAWWAIGGFVDGSVDDSWAEERNKLEKMWERYKTEGQKLEQPSDSCSNIEENMRFDCYPQGSEVDCKKRGCCWLPAKTKGAPYCFYPAQYTNYHFLNMTEDKHSLTVFYELIKPSGYPGDFKLVRMDFKYLADDMLQVKIYDANHKRFEPPYPEIPTLSKTITQLKYRVMVEGPLIGFKVIRNSDNVTIFNAQNVGGLILSDKFLQISAVLPTDHIYGLGEKRAPFKNDMNWQTFAIFNRDRVPVEGANLYGSQPFYLAVEHNGMAHGTLLLNTNAMDIVLQPTPAVTYRTTGGVLDLYIVTSPTPAAVVAQYTALVGRPAMPPYWGLGFHLSKFNYGSVNTTRDVWKANRDAGIPFDTQWNDIDYMNNANDFTYDTEKYAGLPEFVKEVHSEGMHYVIIIDPGVSASEKVGTYPPYDRGIEMDIFVKNSTNQPFVAKVWNKGTTVFPDFTHPNSTSYWVEMMSNFHKTIPFDGAWIDMNEPSNFEDGSVYGRCQPENLPYLPKVGQSELHAKTLCMEAKHFAGSHYNWHNLYAITEAIATNFALSEIRGKRPFIISRASSVGFGKYAGHWSGDINSDWHDMKMTIPELLSFSLFGIPLMGADICGFRGNTTPELCKRWMQLGAFYPFSRNHNSDSSIPQDPVSLGPDVVAASRKALRIRYKLLPYYYTLFWRAHTRGETVARPLFFEWPDQIDLHSIDDQFLIGPYLMITPILKQGATSTKAYFPGPETWYQLTGERIGSGQWVDVDENTTVSVRGGAILPLQPPPRGPVSTWVSRSAPLQLCVSPDKDYYAAGDVYWDDGDSMHSYQEKKYSHIEFYHNFTEFRSTVRWWGYGVPSLEKITFFNQSPVKSVTFNNQPCKKPCDFTYNSGKKVLDITINVSLDKPFTLSWVYKSKITFKTGALRPGYG